MRIALIAPPFIAVPPRRYGGTELFVGELAKGLHKKGLDVVVYTNGDSTLDVPLRWLFRRQHWPIPGEIEANLKGLAHCAWAVKDAELSADVIHLNSAPGLTFASFVRRPFVYTVHHPYEDTLAHFYSNYPDISYVTISDFQRNRLSMPQMRTIHHGLDPALYRVQSVKQPYCCFLGRIAPPKGTHLAIEIAKKSGIPLKIAGEIQPLFRDYWEAQVKPHVDGRFIEYVGEVGLPEKNDLLGNAMAMLFPIQWDEPFGLVMIESMACGTPVLAMPRGSVREVIQEGVSGHVRGTVDELAECAKNLRSKPEEIRDYMENRFSVERMVNDYIELYAEIAEEELDSRAEPIVA